MHVCIWRAHIGCGTHSHMHVHMRIIDIDDRSILSYSTTLSEAGSLIHTQSLPTQLVFLTLHSQAGLSGGPLQASPLPIFRTQSTLKNNFPFSSSHLAPGSHQSLNCGGGMSVHVCACVYGFRHTWAEMQRLEDDLQVLVYAFLPCVFATVCRCSWKPPALASHLRL